MYPRNKEDFVKKIFQTSIFLNDFATPVFKVDKSCENRFILNNFLKGEITIFDLASSNATTLQLEYPENCEEMAKLGDLVSLPNSKILALCKERGLYLLEYSKNGQGKILEKVNIPTEAQLDSRRLEICPKEEFVVTISDHRDTKDSYLTIFQIVINKLRPKLHVNIDKITGNQSSIVDFKIQGYFANSVVITAVVENVPKNAESGYRLISVCYDTITSKFLVYREEDYSEFRRIRSLQSIDGGKKLMTVDNQHILEIQL